MAGAPCVFCAEELPVDAEGLERCPSCGERLGEPEAELPWRPTSLLVLGVLNICFGALGALAGVGALVMLVVASQNGGRFLGESIVGDSPVAFVLEQLLNLLGGVAGLALGAVGVGLLLMKPWGRRISLICAVYMIVHSLLGIAIAVVQIGPTTAAGVPVVWIVVGLAGATCFSLIYPTALLVLLNRQVVLDAFRRAEASATEAAPAAD